MKDRPFGVALISLLVAVEAILQVLAALGLFGLSVAGLFETPYTGAGAALMAIGITVFIIGFVQLIVAAGLWNMHRWAWLVAVIVAWVDVVFDVIGGVAGTHTLTATVWSLVIPIVVLVYLYQPTVKRLFE